MPTPTHPPYPPDEYQHVRDEDQRRKKQRPAMVLSDQFIALELPHFIRVFLYPLKSVTRKEPREVTKGRTIILFSGGERWGRWENVETILCSEINCLQIEAMQLINVCRIEKKKLFERTQKQKNIGSEGANFISPPRKN